MTEEAKQRPREIKIVATNPSSVWPSSSFHEMVERICTDEIEAMVSFGHKPSDTERRDIRSMVIFNINAHTNAAGNA